jgi:dipeptidyl aminopeptidase/acylaminoacyl peptidase
MMPVITQRLRDEGLPTFYYGNFNDAHTQWKSYGHEPRYSTEYVGMRGRLAVLVEAYSYISYHDRIVAIKDFVAAILDYAAENQRSIHRLIETTEGQLVQTAEAQPERIPIALSAKATAFEEKFVVKGFKDDVPHDYECDFVGNYVPTSSTVLPFAYMIPRQFDRVLDRLKKHGVQIERVTENRMTLVEVDTISDLTQSPTKFQKHQLVRAEATREQQTRNIVYGDYLVRTGQPLGRFISYMLESASDDGFVSWNFFDDHLAVGSEYPVWRVPDPIYLRSEPVNKLLPNGEITLDRFDGPRSILPDESDPPNWFGNTNWIKTKIYSRDLLIDAATASFVKQPENRFDAEKLVFRLIAQGVSEKSAKKLANSDPLVSDNGKYAVFSDDQQAFLFFIDGIANQQDPLLRLGSPEKPGELFDFNFDDSKLGYVTESGLHLLDLTTQQETVIETVDNHNLVGKLDWVYQEELYGRGNFKAFWWNPANNQVAFLSLDESPVLPFTVMDHLPIRGNSEFTNYPKAGDPLPTAKLGVAAADSAVVNWVDLSQYADKEFLISQVGWSSNGDVLLAQIQNREQTWLDLLAANPAGENLRRLFRDQTPAWIQSPGDPAFISDNEFLWLSPRSGLNQIYKYSLDGELLDQLTNGEWEVRKIIGIDPQQESAYFSAAENAIDLHGYRLDLATGKTTQLTTQSGNHELNFSHDYSMFLDQFSTASQPAETWLYANDGTFLHRLNVSSDDRLDFLRISDPVFITIPTSDDVNLDAMLIRPFEFGSSGKYPVLVHVYAGPQNPNVRNRFANWTYFWHQMLAQQGYVVMVLDVRSASYRSSRNVWPIHQLLAASELADIEAGVDWLKKQSWADNDRLGIWGWSYGGYMTLYALTHSQSFKAGIAGAPVTDWKNYDAIYTERYMGLPSENPDGYAASSVLNSAHDLHGELLLIHGTIDDNVHLNNSIQFIEKLQDAGKQFEMMFYPGNRHSIKDQKQSAHMRNLMTDFILNNL